MKKITKAFETYGVISLDQKGKTRLEMIEEVNHGTVILQLMALVIK